MASVTFSPAVGGDGTTVTDGNDQNTGLAAGGHRVRFVPALTQFVAIANYVVGLATGLANAVFTPVLVATTANITLSGEQTIDGILTSASRVLVKNQSTASQNGIYVSAAGAWVRATDADISADWVGSKFVPVQQGTDQADTQWVCTTDGSITLGSTSLAFVQVPRFVDLASTAAGKGASLIGIQDAAGLITATTVEAALAELAKLPQQTQAGAYTLVATDRGQVVRGTAAGAQTFTLTAAATLGASWWAVIEAAPGAIITIDPNSAELINGIATIKVGGGGAVLVQCIAGTSFRALRLRHSVERVPVTSATTIDLTEDVIGSRYVLLTGSTGPIGTITLPNGEVADVVLDAASTPTITYHATTLITPGAANIVTQASDNFEVRGESAGRRILRYTRHSLAIPPGNAMGVSYLYEVGNINTGGDSTINIPAGSWRQVELKVRNLKSASDYAPYIRFNGLATSLYSMLGLILNSAGSTTGSPSGTATSGAVIYRTDVLIEDSAVTENPYDFDLILPDPATARYHGFRVHGGAVRNTSGGGAIASEGIGSLSGRHNSAVALTAINLLLRASTGASPTGATVNASAGTYELWVTP